MWQRNSHWEMGRFYCANGNQAACPGLTNLHTPSWDGWWKHWHSGSVLGVHLPPSPHLPHALRKWHPPPLLSDNETRGEEASCPPMRLEERKQVVRQRDPRGGSNNSINGCLVPRRLCLKMQELHYLWVSWPVHIWILHVTQYIASCLKPQTIHDTTFCVLWLVHAWLLHEGACCAISEGRFDKYCCYETRRVYSHYPK